MTHGFRPPVTGASRHWRRPAPAGRVIYVMAIMLAVWLLFDAVNLHRAAQVSPPGTRRSASLDVTGPVALLSRIVGFAEADRAFDAVLGKRPGLLPQADGSVHEVLRPTVTYRVINHGLVSLGRYGEWEGLGGLAIVQTVTARENADRVTQPVASNPLRVLIIGDSVGGDMGKSLSNYLFATGIVAVDLDTHAATGLARPDYFNWPDEVRADIAQFHPQVTVAMFGGNDGQGFEENGQVYSFGTAAWDQIYSVRVNQLLQMLTSGGASAVWIGMPPMADPTLNSEMQTLNGIYAQQAASVPRAYYVASAKVLGVPGSGGYGQYLPVAPGQVEQVRQDDGVHLTIAGANLIAATVQLDMGKLLGIRL